MVTLIGVAVLTLPFFIVLICLNKQNVEKRLLNWVLNCGGVITGIYIFVGAFYLPDGANQNAIWGGITGFIMTLVTVKNIIREVQSLRVRKVKPKKAASAREAL